MINPSIARVHYSEGGDHCGRPRANRLSLLCTVDIHFWNGIWYHSINHINHFFLLFFRVLSIDSPRVVAQSSTTCSSIPYLRKGKMTQTPSSDAQPRLKLTQPRTEHKWSQQDVADLIATTGLYFIRSHRGSTI